MSKALVYFSLQSSSIGEYIFLVVFLTKPLRVTNRADQQKREKKKSEEDPEKDERSRMEDEGTEVGDIRVGWGGGAGVGDCENSADGRKNNTFNFIIVCVCVCVCVFVCVCACVRVCVPAAVLKMNVRMQLVLTADVFNHGKRITASHFAHGVNSAGATPRRGEFTPQLLPIHYELYCHSLHCYQTWRSHPNFVTLFSFAVTKCGDILRRRI